MNDTEFLIGFSAEHRVASGIKGGDSIQVTLKLDLDPRTKESPNDLLAALQNADLLKAFEQTALK